jgi:hypothetical protein
MIGEVPKIIIFSSHQMMMSSGAWCMMQASVFGVLSVFAQNN